MPDPIQSSSTIPLPVYQTQKGRLDPLPEGSPELNRKQGDEQVRTRKADADDAFRSYLDQSQLSVVSAAKHDLEYNAADDINASSTYRDSGRTSPL